MTSTSNTRRLKKKLRSIKYIHFYRQNYSNTPCRLKKQVVLAMCPYKIKLCSFLYPKFSQSLVSCWASAFLILPFYFSSSSHTLSFISLQGWKFFTFPSLSSIPVVDSSCYMFSTFTLHIPFSLAFPSYQTVYELCCKQCCMKWFSVLPAAGRVLL